MKATRSTIEAIRKRNEATTLERATESVARLGHTRVLSPTLKQSTPDIPSVLYVGRVLPAYRHAVFELLNERLGGRLLVATGDPPADSSLHTLSSKGSPAFAQIAVKNRWLVGERVHVGSYRRLFDLESFQPNVLLAEESPRSVSLPLLLRLARRRGLRTLLWGHFSSNRRPFSPRNPADRYRIRLAKSVDGCVCYTEQIRTLLAPFVPPDRLFVATNTLDTRALFAKYDRLVTEGRDAVRERLGLPKDRLVMAFVGRLIESKGISMLLDVYHRVAAERAATLIVVGDGPERATIEAWLANRANDQPADVRLAGIIPDPVEAAETLFAADVLVNPGDVGLAVDHAFSVGLPVVTQVPPPGGGRFHGPELSYVQPGVNGLLTKWSDVDAMVNAVHSIMADRASYSRNAVRFAVEHLSIERMVDGLEAAIRASQPSDQVPS